MNISSHLRSSTPKGRSKSVTRSSSMGTSPRMAPLSATLRGNVLFTGSVDDSTRLSYRGPGSYFQSMNPSNSFTGASSLYSPLARKSFNIRAQNGNLMGQQTAFRKTQKTSSFISSPIKTQQLQHPQRQQQTVKRIIKTAWSQENDTTMLQSSPSRNLSRTPIDPRARIGVDEETPSHFNVLRSDRATPYRQHPFPHRNLSFHRDHQPTNLDISQSQRGVTTPRRPTGD